jgi:aminoglycoside phosphotransferase family enzyme
LDWAGELELDGVGHTVEWLVEMHRLPEGLILENVILAGRARTEDALSVARRLVAFYADLPPERIGPEAHAARLERELALTASVLSDPGLTFDGDTVPRTLEATALAMERARSTLLARARDGHIVEGHGDLRPEHVCLGEPPVVIDGLEFDRGLRLVDPFDEIVFLGLECARLGADWVLPVLLAELREGLGEDPPVELLRFYWRYRALLRARLSLLHLVEANVRHPEKWRPQARRYVELAGEAELRFRS